MIDVRDIEAALNEDSVNCATLMLNNKTIVARQKTPENWQECKAKIFNLLRSPHLEEGIYKVKYGNSYTTCNREKVLIKGDQANDLKVMKEVSKDLQSELNENDRAMLIHLKIMNQIQKDEIESLLEENEQLNQELEELQKKLTETTTLSEPAETPLQTAKTMFSEIVQIGVPLLDKYFQIQEEKNQILKMQQNSKIPGSYSAPIPAPKKDSLQIRIESWINSKSENPEVFENLQAIYYNSSDVQKFAELLKDYNENLYNECRSAIQ